MGGYCFVITPYGTKEVEFVSKGADGFERKYKKSFDFKQVYEQIVDPAIKAAGFVPVVSERQDDILITKGMFRGLRTCDAAIADITMPNPNVFYELGVRHALRRHRTILIRHKDAARMSNDSDLPFDLMHLRLIKYEMEPKLVEAAKVELTDKLKKTPGPLEFDSPVFEALPYLTVGREGRSLAGDRRRPKFFLLSSPDKSIGIAPGELQDISFVDVWVNSENTQFEMARFGERAISSTIRHLGSTKRKTIHGEFHNDEVNKDLQREKKRLALGQTHVKQAQVALTPPRALAGHKHNVRMIAHVAAVKSEPGQGFTPVDNLGMCVRNVISEIASYNRRALAEKSKLRHVLFPLLATGQATENPEVVVPPLVGAAIEALESIDKNSLREVWFLARDDLDFDLLDRYLRERTDKLKAP